MLEYSTVRMSNYQSFIQPTKIFPRHKKELTFSLDCYPLLHYYYTVPKCERTFCLKKIFFSSVRLFLGEEGSRSVSHVRYP